MNTGLVLFTFLFRLLIYITFILPNDVFSNFQTSRFVHVQVCMQAYHPSVELIFTGSDARLWYHTKHVRWHVDASQFT